MPHSGSPREGRASATSDGVNMQISRMQRILHGEPVPDKQWTVYYNDCSLLTRLMISIFGIRGCQRIDCDYIMAGTESGDMTMMIVCDGNNVRGLNVWTSQIEQIVCNWGMDEIITTAQNLIAKMLSSSQNDCNEEMYG